MKVRKPAVEDIVSYEGEEFRVLTLLSSQFVCECVTEERGDSVFIFYRDQWKVNTY